MTGEENGVPNPNNLTAAARRILPRPFGARAGRGRVPRTPGGTRKDAATLDDAILHLGGVCLCGGRNQPHHSFPKREARRERVGRDFVSPARSNHSPCEFSLFIADSHLPVALTAPSARGCTVCHVGLSRPALDGRQHSSAKCKQFSVYERVLFVSGPHRITSHHQPPTSNTGPAPEPDYRRDCPRSKPRVGEASPRLAVSATPSVRRFWRSGGGGAPLYVSRLHHPPLSGPELEGDDAHLPRRRISEDSQ